MIATLLATVLSLADVERAALAHSPTVAQARAAVNERSALLRAAGATAVPHAFANYLEAPQGGNTDNTIQQHLTTAGAAINLAEFAQHGSATAQAQAELRGAQADELAAERTERIKTIGLYFDATRTREILALRQNILNAAKADVRAAKLRYASGDAPRLDVVRADVAVDQDQADVSAAQADAANALHALAVETGTPEAEIALPPLAQLTHEPNLPATPDAAVALALQHRPEIASANAAVAAEESAVQVAHRSTLPGLTAQAGWATGVDSGVPVSGPSVNVTLDVPLSHAASDRATAESARLDQARYALAQQTQTIDVEVASALRTYQADVVAASAAMRARKEAQAEVSATELGYRSGALSSLDLVDARRTYAQAAVTETTAAATVLQAQATLNLTMGTGE